MLQDTFGPVPQVKEMTTSFIATPLTRKSPNQNDCRSGIRRCWTRHSQKGSLTTIRYACAGLSALVDIRCVFSSGTLLYNYYHLQEIESKSLEESGKTAESTVQLVKAVSLSVSNPRPRPPGTSSHLCSASSQDIFKQANEDRLTSAKELPYFEGDFWPNVLEESIKELEQEEEERKKEESTAASETPEVQPYLELCPWSGRLDSICLLYCFCSDVLIHIHRISPSTMISKCDTSYTA